MKNVLIIISLTIFSFFNSQNIPYENISQNSSYKILDIDINKDGIKDKVGYNQQGNDLLFYIKKENNYINVFHGDNYTMDGIYSTDQIKGYYNNDHVLYIKNIFNGAGGQIIEYFIVYKNKKWELSQTITTSFNFQKTKICNIDALTDNKEYCITTNNNNPITDITQNIKSNKNLNFYSEEYLFSLLNKISLSTKTVTQYNNLAFQLEQVNKYKEAIYLLQQILQKFPTRVVTYLNLADIYWTINNKNLATDNYKKYVMLMKSQKKDLNKIPKQVYERIKE